MKFIGDFHIHSHYSVATSKELRPDFLDYWARLKGIKVVGTGDFTHPGWLQELKEQFEPAENGLFKVKQEYQREI
jgi:DNA helicase-2/ATP-dependent DNA helicase PcrA